MGEVFTKILLVLSVCIVVILPSGSCMGQNRLEVAIPWDQSTYVPDQQGDMVRSLHFKGSEHYREFEYGTF